MIHSHRHGQTRNFTKRPRNTPLSKFDSGLPAMIRLMNFGADLRFTVLQVHRPHFVLPMMKPVR